MSYLIGTAPEIKRELDHTGVGEFESVDIVEILRTKAGNAIMLVEISEPYGGDE